MPSPNIAAAAPVHPAVDDVPDGQSGQNHQDLFGRKHLNVLDLLSSYLNLINLLQLFKSRKEGSECQPFRDRRRTDRTSSFSCSGLSSFLRRLAFFSERRFAATISVGFVRGLGRGAANRRGALATPVTVNYRSAAGARRRGWRRLSRHHFRLSALFNHLSNCTEHGNARRITQPRDRR